ncbi:MAG: hypothetical protein GXW85_02965 [Clostridia bacterium]|nr:hypothetical protein [Clostridia bacterium]
MLNGIPLIETAYVVIFIGVVLKTIALYVLTGKKNKPIEERKKIYLRFNLPANILIALGVIILAIIWYS